ncbi:MULTISPECIES: F0F1 ATP synthase subunit epsilon [unclassified Nocardioides]|jgi:F-type H+-transporting ATPase subunit epsilon|uniref:F0F1 ATP synthase subunit epsilon n=1 Tax=unclassified Nocardioides TaxID=2615069 RepID=UPI0007031393|nr:MULTISPECIES: F0F1 ATP synthase subunit epsilon [unclassified Nocardioides]KRC56828.1 ATP synthase subunit epsilon [Nocardioides sp. Root79]KRC77037.1 ATP synthase subunit epsilon [Nocardioides sp. Root240]
MAETAVEHLHVELVAADRTVWSGEAAMIIARTLEGDIGVLRGHAPTLSLLQASVVEIQVAGTNQLVVVAVDGGVLSVANDRVSILAEHIEKAEDIEVSQARIDLEEAKRLLDSSNEAEQRLRHAEARIRAAEKVS